MASPPTGTVTFLFTDIEGSTKMWEQDSSSMQVALSRHDEMLRRVTEEHGGYVFKTVGDAFCCAFPTAPEALDAAIETQRRLLSEAWKESGPIRVRMALHTGAAEEREGDYFGPSLNRVARLLSAAHGGQVLLSAATHEMVRDQLPAGATLMDLGERSLKDLFRPEKVFQLSAQGLPSEFPPLRTLDAHRNNLPLQPTPLVGREKEVADICERLSRPEVRLLTLTGAGGTGKTRLGLQAAAELTGEFEDGVFFVSLAAIRDPELVVGAVAGTLGVKEAGGRPLLESLEDYLGEKHILFVVDNFEQVLVAAPVVSGLLSSASNLKVLATSRIPLGLYGEHEYAVPPLALPDPERPPPVERLTHYEAVRLFAERARAAKADFSVTNENAPAVAEICHRLDGLPLAIELAAARIKLLTPQAMLARLGNRLKLLTGGARDLPERQRTLRSTIEWSYGLLGEGEKVLFARLSVFAGGRTLEALEAICDAEGDLPVDVLDGVSSLVDESLLRREEGVRGEPRYVMLETIHEFAREKLKESGEAEPIKRVHAEYFLALAEEAEPQLIGPREAEWFDRLGAELGNLRTALSWAQARGETELGLRLAGALTMFWSSEGLIGEGRSWLEEALAQEGPTSALARAKALGGAGLLARAQGDLGRMKAAADEGLGLSSVAGTEGIRIPFLLGGSPAAYFLNLLALAAAEEGDHEAMAKLSEKSLRLSRQANDAQGSANSLLTVAVAVARRGDYERAEVLFEEGLGLARELDSASGRFLFLNAWANAALHRGDYQRGTALAEEAVELARERRWGFRGNLPYALDTLGWSSLLGGEPQRSKVQFEENLAVSENLGDKGILLISLEGLACVAAAEGEALRAARLFGAAGALMETIDLRLTPQEDAMIEPYRTNARSQLGEVAWEGALAEGRGMGLDRAVEYALQEEEASG